MYKHQQSISRPRKNVRSLTPTSNERRPLDNEYPLEKIGSLQIFGNSLLKPSLKRATVKTEWETSKGRPEVEAPNIVLDKEQENALQSETTRTYHNEPIEHEIFIYTLLGPVMLLVTALIFIVFCIVLPH